MMNKIYCETFPELDEHQTRTKARMTQYPVFAGGFQWAYHGTLLGKPQHIFFV